MSQESDEVEIPANLQSAETYKFVGATYGLRKDYDRYLSQPEDVSADFYHFVVWHVKEPGRANATSAQDDSGLLPPYMVEGSRLCPLLRLLTRQRARRRRQKGLFRRGRLLSCLRHPA